MCKVVSVLFIIFAILSSSIGYPDTEPPQGPSVIQIPQSEAAMFEAVLNALAASNLLPGPVVAVIDPEPQRLNPNKPVNRENGDIDGEEKPVPPFDPSRCGSIQELAQAFGLQVFEQSGIYVIAPPMRLDLQAMYSGRWTKSDVSANEIAYARLMTGFNRQQLKALGSADGLSYSRLTPQQHALLAVLMPANAALWQRGADEVPSGRRLTVADIPLACLALKCRLRPGATLIAGGDAVVDLIDHKSYFDDMRDRKGEWLARSPEEYPNFPMIPNALKPSDLDYNGSELMVVTDIGGPISLRDLVVRISRDTGLILTPCLGAENVKLFVYSGRKSAGSVLKAVMLAVQSSWRRFGNGYLLVADNLGICPAAATVFEAGAMAEIRRDDLQDSSFDPVWLESALTLLPWEPGFPLTPSQVQMIAKWDGNGQSPLTVDILTPEQGDLIKRRLDASRQSSEWKEPESPFTHIRNQFIPLLVLDAPGIGIIEIEGNLGLIKPGNGFHQRMDAQAPSDLSMPIKLPVRGLMLKPGRGDTSDSIAKTLTLHGFNTLYLRVFSDGFTIFPSKSFPIQDWITGPEYLTKVLKTAHDKGIKVFALIDVLRWSDGDRKHWIRGKPELLDYDVLGRTQSEWVSVGLMSKQRVRSELFLMGDARLGDVVTPLSPAVNDMLSDLIDELSGYPFDGLALDHTSILHTNMGMLYTDTIGGQIDQAGFYISSEQPGFNEVSRGAFISSYGLDPIDLPLEYAEMQMTVPETSISPLMKVVESSAISKGLAGKWPEFYRKSCDNLLDSLISRWQKAKKEALVWVVDTYSEDLDLAHNWGRFVGRVDGLLNTLAMDMSTYPGHAIKRVTVLRAADSVGTLMFGSMLARLSGNTFPGMLGPIDEDRKAFAGQGIVIDLACSEKRRGEFLRMIPPAAGASRNPAKGK